MYCGAARTTHGSFRGKAAGVSAVEPLARALVARCNRVGSEDCNFTKTIIVRIAWTCIQYTSMNNKCS